jgi:hypothetical protein
MQGAVHIDCKLPSFAPVNPRVVWFCQVLALAISAVVAPSSAFRARLLFLVSARSIVADLAAFCGFLPPTFAFADFFDPALDCLATGDSNATPERHFR